MAKADKNKSAKSRPAAGKEKPVNPFVANQDSKYDALTPANANPPAGATFIATMKLGDNSSDSAGIAEASLSGVAGQLAWGTDINGNVNSDVNYPGGVYVELDVPVNTSPQSAATLQVGDVMTPITFTPGSSYGTILKVVVTAFTNIGSSPAPDTNSIHVEWTNLVCTFYDSGNVPTSNPNSLINPKSIQALLETLTLTSNGVVIQPKFPDLFTPVRVNVSGTLRMWSSDAYYQNYGSDLSSTSLKAMICVYT